MRRKRIFLFSCFIVLLGACGGDFSTSINRSFSTPQEEQRIIIAEEAPPASLPLWSGEPIDGVLIALAVNREAVLYYTEMIHQIQQGNFPSRIEFSSAKFDYQAHIEHHEEFRYAEKLYNSVDVVTLELKWQHSCGNLCGLSYEQQRQVVFDASGDILAIIGDGRSYIIVS
jgi:hypothetical protein